MLHLLKRHPLPMEAFFRHALVLTYALEPEVLRPLLPRGLTLDTYRDSGFLAIAMVQTQSLRPAGVPALLGQEFFLAGYRVFARLRPETGRTFRGLRILRSDTDSRLMAMAGNLMTHYNYRRSRIRFVQSDDQLEISIRTRNAQADLHVLADLASRPAPLPQGSPFETLQDARRFAGPLPFTFDYERQTNSIIAIQGVRRQWDPQPIRVTVLENTFFDQPPFRGHAPVLANAFHVESIPYRWERGVVYPLAEGA